MTDIGFSRVEIFTLILLFSSDITNEMHITKTMQLECTVLLVYETEEHVFSDHSETSHTFLNPEP